MKKWKRDWKLRLIERENPNWLDLYPTLFGEGTVLLPSQEHREVVD